MDKFEKLIKDEITVVLEALTGILPKIELKEVQDISIISNIIPPVVYTTLPCFINDKASKILMSFSHDMAINLSYTMMGEEFPTDLTDITDDDLDATKEIIHNIWGAAQNSLSVPNDNFGDFQVNEKPLVKYLNESQELSLEDYNKLYVYSIEMNDFKSIFVIAYDEIFVNNIELTKVAIEEKREIEEIEKIDKEELINKQLVDKLTNIEMEVTLRIGKTQMLLRDIINIDIGTIIELEQLSNAPIELLVENVLIALGEVVIIDGNFGIQITEIVVEANNQIIGT
jgi:flagellar motor switch protein FliN/FliY